MKIKKKTLLNLLLILFVLSFFVTPLGYYGKIALMQVFSSPPRIVAVSEREKLPFYDWTLKDANWEFFNFERSRGKVVLIAFWRSWILPSLPELKGIQSLYEDYGEQVEFYIITDEEQAPVMEFIQEHDFTFPVTYLYLESESPVASDNAPRSYLIDSQGYVVIDQEGIADWDSKRVRELLDELLKTP